VVIRELENCVPYSPVQPKQPVMKRISILLMVLMTMAATAQQKDRLTLDDYANYESVASPNLSPDRSQILYTRQWINLVEDKRESDLWIVNSDGSQNRFFMQGGNGLWSPDGQKVAFMKEGEPKGTQIYVKYLGVEGEPTQITRTEKTPSHMKWSPDGSYLAFTMFVEENDKIKIDIPAPPEGANWTKAPRVVDEVNYRRDRIGYLENGTTHIFIVPAEGGTARQITQDEYDYSGAFDWSADGSHIIFSSLREPDADYKLRQSNIYRVNIANGAIQQLTDRNGFETSPKVSPDGRRIAFVGNKPTDTFYQASRIFIMNADGSDMKMLTDKLDRSPSDFFWAEDNDGIYFNVSQEGRNNLHYVNLKGAISNVTEGMHMLNVDDVNGNVAVAVITTPQSPPDVALVDLGSGKINQLTHVNKDILDFIQLGEVEEIWYKSPDGTNIQGWIVKPPDFDPNKKYPLILRIHGGPHAMYNVGFNYNFQIHAAKDYVTLYTNPRGSTGYGYDFANAIQNSYPGDDYTDLMTGVDEVIKRGYIDESRMYVYGGSGGGVLTSWIIGQTDRFAAASVMYPVVDWFSFVGTTDGIGWYQNFKKFPWEDPTEHIKRSPLMYVGNVTTPTLLMTGVNDLRTPISQTEEYYQALKVQNKPVVMIRFNDEFHGTSSKPSNFLRTMGYLDYWFAKYKRENDQVMDTQLEPAK
jgi:dipeptidyl aminopeptidase/acylaminoacyl peptidase